VAVAIVDVKFQMISSYSRRPTVEAFRSIDIRDIRPKLLKRGLVGSWKWSRAGEPTGSMQFKIEGNVVLLEYLSDIDTQIHQHVQLTWTSCALGGQRPWFRCRCGRRAAVLYAVGEAFDCRRCCGLGYDSQYEGPAFRSLRRAHAIRQRLGGELDIFSPFPPKPRGMHRKTYDHLRDRGLLENQLAIDALRGVLARPACSRKVVERSSRNSEDVPAHRLKVSRPL
jgi:hypothetical protein